MSSSQVRSCASPSSVTGNAAVRAGVGCGAVKSFDEVKKFSWSVDACPPDELDRVSADAAACGMIFQNWQDGCPVGTCPSGRMA